ncbi:hypothetical protein ATY81_26890 [Rhizobium sp. R72]|nr:hypothetical protein ATY81_26890 [Rhizobium sp. R72]OWV98689.1 hypothetical protein ATY80_26890 [Rhizobium sp. R711]
MHREELGRFDFGNGALEDYRVLQPGIEVELHGYQVHLTKSLVAFPAGSREQASGLLELLLLVKHAAGALKEQVLAYPKSLEEMEGSHGVRHPEPKLKIRPKRKRCELEAWQ